VAELRGIGPRKREALAALDVETVLDLLTLYPRRYIDRTNETTIVSVQPEVQATLLVVVRRCSDRRQRPPQAHLLQPAVAGQAAA